MVYKWSHLAPGNLKRGMFLGTTLSSWEYGDCITSLKLPACGSDEAANASRLAVGFSYCRLPIGRRSPRLSNIHLRCRQSSNAQRIARLSHSSKVPISIIDRVFPHSRSKVGPVRGRLSQGLAFCPCDFVFAIPSSAATMTAQESITRVSSVALRIISYSFLRWVCKASTALSYI